LDTNILVYAVDEQSGFHAVCRDLLTDASRERPGGGLYCVTPQVLAEFFAVVTSPRRVKNPRSAGETLEVIERLLGLPGLAVLPIPVDVVFRWVSLVRAYELRSSDVFDAQLVATMLANGVRKIYTFDRPHFQRFSDLQVLTPQ
jgi:predicted nucleic acid-binding protein